MGNYGNDRPPPSRGISVGWAIAQAVLMVSVVALSAHAYSPERVSFTVKCKDVSTAYRIMSFFVVPDELVKIDLKDDSQSSPYASVAAVGVLTSSTTHAWHWRAPHEPGLYRVVLRRDQPLDSMILNFFVMIPYSGLKDGQVNGYAVGRYPTIPYLGLSIYKAPPGFVEVTPDIEDTPVTPHLTLKQFLCKENGGYPKYLVLSEKLLVKLELTLERLNEKGYHCEGLSILSGYRTPVHNRATGNVKYSRHQWGSAADIYIDENPADGMMDDLNKDGLINSKDAEVVYDIIDEMDGHPLFDWLIGGLGWYHRTTDHGPFVHVDVRGHRARWAE